MRQAIPDPGSEPKMREVLVSWIGHADLRAPTEEQDAGIGPVAQALQSCAFDDAYLIADHDTQIINAYLDWLNARTSKPDIHLLRERLSGPTNFGEIYQAAVRASDRALCDTGGEASLTFHLSPGTPAMAAVWIILAKTRFPAKLIESSREHGVQTVAVPFDISADFLPDLLRRPDKELERLAAGLPPEHPEFDEIVHASQAMKRVIVRARLVATRSVPVLVEGETGTGKELLARAIHGSSPRRDHPFVAVNCGALPQELVEAELFGHEKGAFTGAISQRDGHFVTAHGGTLFLDEVGELPKPAQVKLLRVLQESEILPVGRSRPRKVDVRLIAATNRSLIAEVQKGAFREDLFHRLAVAILRLAPLRERHEDLALLIESLLDQANREGTEQPGYIKKKLSVSARNIMLSHQWPGNVRELQNTLRRAALWSAEETLTTDDISEALLPMPHRDAGILHRSLGKNFDLQELLEIVARHYLGRALAEANGNKTQAAKLTGLSSYQTFANWMKRYGVHG